MTSMVIGCETTKDINENLGVEKLALNILCNNFVTTFLLHMC